MGVPKGTPYRNAHDKIAANEGLLHDSTLSDTDIARLLGCERQSVTRYRKKHADRVPDGKLRAQKRLEENEHLFYTDTGEEIANKLGCSINSVTRYRREHPKLPRRVDDVRGPKTDNAKRLLVAPYLGVLSDKRIHEITGVSCSTIRAYRELLGIPAFDVQAESERRACRELRHLAASDQYFLDLYIPREDLALVVAPDFVVEYGWRSWMPVPRMPVPR